LFTRQEGAGATKIKEEDMERLKALPWYWPSLVIVFLLCVMEYRGILGNWSTIVLVAFTMIYVMLIYKSISQTSILRREDRELDFKLRKLDWIVNTAREIKKELLMPLPLTFQLDSTVKSTLIKELQSYAGEWIITIDTAKIFGDEFERIVEKAEKDLFAYIKELEKPAPDHKRYIMGLNQSFSNVLKSALKVEHDLVNKSQDVTPWGHRNKRRR